MQATQNITRRSVVRDAGAIIAAGAIATVAPQAFATEAPASSSETWDYETDVLVAGCGTGGSAAAVEAADGGAEVLIVEKNDWLGGQLRRCGGCLAAAGTSVQKALGIEDSGEAFYTYWSKACDGLADDDLIRDWTMNSSTIIDYIIDELGGPSRDQWKLASDEVRGWDGEGKEPVLETVSGWLFERVGEEPVARGHWFPRNAEDPIINEPETYFYYPTAGGTGLWKLYNTALENRSVQILTETALKRLVTAPGTNEVIGAVCEGPAGDVRIKARKGVVVATGNWASNPQMFRNYAGEGFIVGPAGGMGEVDLPGDNDGSGIKASQALGADLVYPGIFGMNDHLPQSASYAVGGMKVTVDGRVIDIFGEEIPRLYAAGIAAGGVIVGKEAGGASLGRCLYFGRKVGADVAARENWE